jgi:toxin ParE1/3/4
VKVDWRPLAEADLGEIVAYIAAEDPLAAYAIHDEIREQILLLAEHPHIGRQGRTKGTRELVIVRTPYVAAYQLGAGTVTILRVMHGARKWPKRM